MPDINELIEQGHNFGVIEEIWPEDHIAGLQGLAYRIVLADGNWRQFRSSGENQFGTNGDKLHCVSRGRSNAEEGGVNRLYQNNLLAPATREFLEKNGYIVNGKVEFNVRYLAQMSGTTRSGNSMSKVADTARRLGFLPRNYPDYPDDTNLPWDQYYVNPPAKAHQLAAEYKKHFSNEYAWIAQGVFQHSEQSKQELVKWSKCGIIQVATALCPPWNVDTVPVCGLTQATHSYIIDSIEAGSKLVAFDHYPPYEKNLPWQYIIPYAMVHAVTPLLSLPAAVSGELHAKIGSLMKKKDVYKDGVALQRFPAIYIYWFDKKWHGLGDMELRRAVASALTEIIQVDELPVNIGFTVIREEQTERGGTPSFGDLLKSLFIKK